MAIPKMNKMELYLLALALIVALSLVAIIIRRNDQKAKQSSLSIAELIRRVKLDLDSAEKIRINNGESPLFRLKSFDLELKFVVSQTQKGGGKFDYEVVTLEGEQENKSENVQTITLHMEALAPEEKEIAPDTSIKNK
jgi:hypothetical protein